MPSTNSPVAHVCVWLQAASSQIWIVCFLLCDFCLSDNMRNVRKLLRLWQVETMWTPAFSAVCVKVWSAQFFLTPLTYCCHFQQGSICGWCRNLSQQHPPPYWHALTRLSFSVYPWPNIFHFTQWRPLTTSNDRGEYKMQPKQHPNWL